MKFSRMTRLAAIITLWVMIFNTLPINLIVYADNDPDPAAAAPFGIGVINNIYAGSGQEVTAQYKLTFYVGGTPVSAPYPEMYLNGKDTSEENKVFFAADGTFLIKGGNSVNFMQSGDFNNFVDSHNIDKITIELTNSTDNDFLLYSIDVGNSSSVDTNAGSKTVTYNIPRSETVSRERLDEFGDPIIDEETGEPLTEEVSVPIPFAPNTEGNPYNENTEGHYDLAQAEYEMTVMTDFNVNAVWFDRGVDRPNDLSFTVTRSLNGTDDPDFVQPSATTAHLTSNNDVYSYHVPQFAPGGAEYTYSSAENPISNSNYKVEPDANAPATYNYILLRSFDCYIKWYTGSDSADAYDPSQADIYKYLKNFRFIDQANDPANNTEIELFDANGDPNYEIEYTTDENGKHMLSIKGLEYLTPDRTAKTYYLEPITTADGGYYDATNHTLPRSGSGDTNPTWTIEAKNDGVYSNNTEKVFQGATLENVRSADISVSGTVNWSDSANAQERVDHIGSDTGELILWRHPDGEVDYISQAATMPLVKTTTGENDEVIKEYIGPYTFSNVPKYDEEGNEYVYYVTERLASNNNAIDYSEYQINYSGTGSAPDGGTITNKLDGTVVFTVEAEWIAAARQGGTADITYEVQVQDSTAPDRWSKVPLTAPATLPAGMEITQDGSVKVTDFSAEQMKKTVVFPELPKYDDDGNKFVYKIVQTNVHRVDTIKGNTVDVSSTENVSDTTAEPNHYKEITLTSGSTTGDKYRVTATPNGDNYTFKYQLVGDAAIKIRKVWNNQGRIIDHRNHSITYKLQRMNDDSAVFADYTDTLGTNTGSVTAAGAYTVKNKQVFLDGSGNVTLTVTGEEHGYPVYQSADGLKTYRVKWDTNTGNVVTDENNNPVYVDENGADVTSLPGNEVWEITVHPDAFDEKGHEYLYQIRETGEDDANNNYHTTYSYDPNDNRFVINNSRAVEGGPGIWIEKKWVDDGEKEFRKPITVVANGAVKAAQNGNQQSVTLSERGQWEGEIGTYNEYTYDPSHFIEESAVASYTSTYTQISEFSNVPAGSTTENGAKWLYHLMNNPAGATDSNSVSLADDCIPNVNYFGTAANTQFVAIYRTPDHYYAVEQQVTQSSSNERTAPSRVTFINTRIGVVNFEIDFRWVVGTWLTSENHDNQNVEIQIVGEDSDGTTHTYTKSIPISDASGKYYIKDLPKYDKVGKVITYALSEISIAGETISINSADQVGTCHVGGQDFKVEISENGFTKGTDANSGDIYKYQVTNTFSSEKSITIYKRWQDGLRPESERPNIYLRRWRKSRKGGAVWEQEPLDYLWQRDSNDQRNHWSYTFSDLPRYDNEGYEYDYRVEELKISGYKKEYLTPQTVTEGGVTTTRWVVRNSNDPFAYPGDEIRNTRYDEITINGEKLWSGINESVFGKQHYPVASVYLYRKETHPGDNSAPVYVDSDKDIVRNGVTETVPFSRADAGQLIAIADIYNGQNSFLFSEVIPDLPDFDVKTYTISDPQIMTNAGTSIVLPKYDEKGYAIDYSNLRERAINGYAFTIKNQKIVNQYTGGDPVEVSVDKRWYNMDHEAVFPDINITLHQVVQVQKQDGSDAYIEYNKFTRKLSKTSGSDTVIILNEKGVQVGSVLLGQPIEETVGDKTVKYYDIRFTLAGDEGLTKYAPNGTEFLYYVTEDLYSYKENAYAHFNSVSKEDNTKLVDLNTSSLILGETNTRKWGFIAEIGAVTTEETLEGTSNGKVQMKSEINNTYEPDDDAYEGKLIVNKHRDFKITNNTDNSEFYTQLGYKFRISRKTPKIAEKNILEIDTNPKYNTTSNIQIDQTEGGKLPSVKCIALPEVFNFQITTPMAAYDANDQLLTGEFEESAVKYYRVEYSFTKTVYSVTPMTLKVTIYPNKHNPNDSAADYNNGKNQVIIEGIAIYAQDAALYEYIIDEFDCDPFKDLDPISETMTKDSNDKYKAEYDLNNELNVFDLKLNKEFGTKYQDENGYDTYRKLNKREYSQYFNDNYVNQLKFTLYRSEDGGNTWNIYKTLNASDENHRINQHDGHEYYYVFKDLPNYNPNETDSNGNMVKYRYYIEEVDTTAGTHVDIGYPERTSTSTPTAVQNAVTAPGSSARQTTTVRNYFESKNIELDKYWEDSDNCDGLRPEYLAVSVGEHVNNHNSFSTDVDIYEILKNEDGWKKNINLPKYYYNGADPIDGLTYDIDELLSYNSQTLKNNYFEEDPTPEELKKFVNSSKWDPEKSGYTKTDWGYLSKDENSQIERVSKMLSSSGSGSGEGAGGVSNTMDWNTFEGLYLENSRPRLSCTLNINKVWSTDIDETWGVRPDSIYVKVMRVLDVPSGGEGSGTSPTPGPALHYDETTHLGNVSGSADVDVIELKGTANYSITINDLPYGKTVADPNSQNNGTFYKYKYYVVECVPKTTTTTTTTGEGEGAVTTTTTTTEYLTDPTASGYDNFGYTWTQTIGTDKVAQKAMETVQSGTTVTASLTGVVTNTPITTAQTLTKTWDDEDDLYNSREDIMFHLMRRRDCDTDIPANWVDLSTDTHAVNAEVQGEKKIGSTYVSKIHSKEDTTFTDETSFTNLPLYDSDGVKFHYRVHEYSIGAMVAWGTANPSAQEEGAPAATTFPNRTWNYYINSSDTDGESKVTNKLVTRPDFQDIELQKIWDDNNNQDSKRPATLTFTLKRQVEENGVMVDKEVLTANVDETTNWTHRWKNCPMFAPGEDHKPYSYYISEGDSQDYTPVTPNYYSEADHTLPSNVSGNQVEIIQFNNKYTPKTTSLTVEKIWDDQNNIYGLRPEKVELELWCEYDIYTATDTDINGVKTHTVSKTGRYVGAVADSAAQIAKCGKSIIPASVTADIDGNIISVTNGAATKLTAADCKFTLTGSDADSNDSNTWSHTFTNLPVYFNVCGDGVCRGKETPVPIKYYVKEKILKTVEVNGVSTETEDVPKQTKDYICPAHSTDVDVLSTDSAHPSTSELKNTLRTHNITVYKNWSDGALQADASHRHYDLDITLTSTNLTSTAHNVGNGNNYYSETKKLTADDSNGVTFRDLPMYINGTAVLYSDIVEKAHHESGDTSTAETYFGYTRTVSNDVKTYETTDGTVLKTVTVTNELPLVTLNVTKNWQDDVNGFYNYWELRPSSIVLDLERSTDGTTWEKVDTDSATDDVQARTVTMTSGVTGNAKDTAPSWSISFAGLRKYSEDNQRYQYRLTEPNINAYTHESASPAFGSSKSVAVTSFTNATDSVSSSLSFTNKLDTADITVNKVWDFNDCIEKPVYNLDISVAHSESDSAPKNIEFIDSITSYTPAKDGKTSTGSVQITSVPKFDKDGQPLTYTVTEAASDATQSESYHFNYGNVTQSITPNANTSVTLKNDLEVTDIKITKTWSDFTNRFNLRPDSITFKLERKTASETNWVEVDTDPNTEGIQPLTVTLTDTANTKDANTWELETTGKLLKYDRHNLQYTYRLTEQNTGLGAYNLPASMTTRGGNVTFNNQLNTHDVSVTKKWANDSSYASATRYDVDVTLYSDTLDCNESGRNVSGKYNETKKYDEKADNTKSFVDLPKYDGNGAAIRYFVKEKVSDSSEPTDPINTSKDANNVVYFKQFTTRYGYVGNCAESKENDGVLNSYTITNTLPTTEQPVKKSWNDDSNSNGLRPEEVQFKLNRKIQTDSGWTSLSTKNCVATESWECMFDNLLQYDADNHPYFYQVEEVYDSNTMGAYEQLTNGEQFKTTGEKEKNSLTLLEFTNKLITNKVKVKKEWDDDGYKDVSSAMHYTLDIKLEPQSGGTQSFTKQLSFSGISNEDAETDFDVPVYNKSHAQITYTVTETSHDGNYSLSGSNAKVKYHYDPDAASYSVEASESSVNSCTITNKLPLTKVSVTKTWDDLHKKHDLRPENVAFEIYRTTNTGTNLTVTGDASTGWENISDSTNNNKLYVKSDVSKVTGDGDVKDTWTFEYDKLLRYSADNKLYRYMVREVYNGTTLGAYEMQQTESSENYVREQNVDRITSGAAANHAVAFTNRLIRRDITVTQVWNEKWGNTDYKSQYQDQRYKVNVNIVCDDNSISNSTFSSDIDIKDSSNNYLDSNSVTFNDVPLYSKTHAPLTYTVTQNKASDVGRGAVLAEADQRHGSNGKFTQASACSNYVAECTSTINNSGELQSFTMTNTLPLVKYTADKTWYDDNNRDGLRPTGNSPGESSGTNTLAFTLTRTGGSTNTESHTVTATEWHADFAVYPEYQPDNIPYGYSMAESSSPDFKYAADYTVGGSSTPSSTSREVTNGVNTETEIAYAFTNTHVPFYGSLKAEKHWVGDTNYYTDTRPTEITFKLQCRYNGGTWTDAANCRYVTEFIKHYDQNYTYSRTIQDPTEGSYEVFDYLPLFVNDPGNTGENYTYNMSSPSNAENGTSYQIEYRVVEVKTPVLNGYDSNAYPDSLYSAGTFKWSYTDAKAPHITVVSGTVQNADSANTKTESITNTLKTLRVEVNKVWNDNSHIPDNEFNHFDVDVKVTSDDIQSYFNSNAGAAQTITQDSGDTIIFYNVPLYNKNGTAAVYTVEELVSCIQYGYVPTYYWNYQANEATHTELSGGSITPTDSSKVLQKTVTEGGVSKNVDYIPITVMNTLPETSVTVKKIWDDFSDTYKLRPSNITLKLYRSADNGSTWEDTAIGTESLSSTNAVSGNTDQWTFTFEKLLKYNASNAEYIFKVEENTVNAYQAPVFTTEKDKTAQNVADSAHQLELTNSLDVTAITVEKEWIDNSYNGADKDSLHYPIQVKLQSVAVSGSVDSFDIEHAPGNASSTYTITAVQGNASKGSVEIPNVPKYDKSGNLINYTVHEKPTDMQNYGDCHYGYERLNAAAEYTVNSGTITIQNELPVTDLSVSKQWTYTSKYHKYAPGAITVDVTRTGYNPSDTSKSTTETIHDDDVISYVSGTSSKTYTNELRYGYDSQPLQYTVTENTPIRGYNADTPSDSVSASSSGSIGFTLQNTEITQNVQFTKIDGTYERLYQTFPGYAANLRKLSGAKFKLYRVKADDDPAAITADNTVCYVTKTDETAGQYAFDKTETASGNTDTIVSGTNGNIEITGLPLGSYKLVEIEAPEGYKLSTTEADRTYTFTLDVDASNTHADTYDGTLSDLMIRNEHETATVTLTKKDASSDSAIKTSKATYLLLRLIPREVNVESLRADGDSAYLTNAKATITGFDFDTGSTTELEKYWHIEGTYQTDENGVIRRPITEFGTYFFMEYRAPIGYKLDNSTASFKVKADPTGDFANTDVFVVTAQNYTNSQEVVHKNERKDANVDIYKQDEFGNPLAGAEFKLYYDPPKTDVTPLSDYDYIFFTDNNHYDGSGIRYYENSTWGQVYAYFYDSNDTSHKNAEFPGEQLTTYWINNETDEGQRVYKFTPPDYADRVVFSNGSGKQTVDIAFKLGHGYYKTGIYNNSNDENDPNNGKYTVNADGNPSVNSTSDWPHATGSSENKSQRYETYGDCIYIKNDTNYIGNVTGNESKWDDLHIYFNNDGGQSSPGYSLPKDVTSFNGVGYYKFEIPIGATKFTVNNGNKGNTLTPIANIQITPNAGYAFTSIDNLSLDGLSTSSSPVSSEFTAPIEVASVITGDDGLTAQVTSADGTFAQAFGNKVFIKQWGTYYWEEVTPPYGYEKDPNVLESFTVDAEKADMKVYISKASDARKKGSVVLSKVAGERVGSFKIGDALTGAEFKLCKKGTTAALGLTEKSQGHYSYGGEGTLVYTMTTVNDTNSADKGKLFIDNLDWGEYVLIEETAPDGFVKNSDAVSFSVGRNNCNETQQLVCRNMGVKATLTITKKLTEYRNNWGTPTFLFKIKQIGGSQSEHTVTIKYDAETYDVTTLKKSSETLSIEPGTYEVTEINVSRYELTGITGTGISSETVDLSNRKITFSVSENSSAELTFTNKIAYYDKFSHTAIQPNHFNGVKGITVSDISTNPDGGTLNTDDGHYYKAIAKSELIPELLMSSGTKTPIGSSDLKNLVISYNGAGKTYDDSRFKVLGNTNSDTFSVLCDPLITSGYVYTLTVSYEYEGQTFTTDFNVTFGEFDVETKQEVTVIFKNDVNNASYFNDDGTITSRYVFTYVMTGTGAIRTIKEIRHNGVVYNGSLNAVSEANSNLSVSSALNSTVTLSGWSIDSATYDNTNNRLTDSEVKGKVLAAADKSVIEIQAVTNAQ